MKNHILQSIKIIILGLALGVGVSYGSAQSWAPPATPASETAAAADAALPVTTGSTDQSKSGGLGLNALLVTLGTQFNGDVYMKGLEGTGNHVCIDADGKLSKCQ